MWVKRLLVNNINPYKPKWKNLALFTAGMANKTLLLHKLSIEMLPQCQSSFYGQGLESWYILSLWSQKLYRKY